MPALNSNLRVVSCICGGMGVVISGGERVRCPECSPATLGDVTVRLRIDTDAVRREVAAHFRRIADELDPRGAVTCTDD